MLTWTRTTKKQKAPEQLYARHKQALRQCLKGLTVMQIVAMTGLTGSACRTGPQLNRGHGLLIRLDNM
jgi:hypothetical protein